MPLPVLTTPAIEVAAPTRQPLRGGLRDAIGPEAVHDVGRLGGQGAGVMYLSDTCNSAVGAFPAPCTQITPPVIAAVDCANTDDLQNAVAVDPFLDGSIFDEQITCTCAQRISYGAPFTLWAAACVNPLEELDTITARARNTLNAGAWRGVERIFAAILPAAATDITPAACQCGIVAAVSALEGQMASCYDGQGIIHAPAWAAPYLAQYMQFSNDAGFPLHTRLGTRFALGGGYTGNGPNEVATDCTFWMYITPQVDVYRGNITVPSIQKTEHNTTKAVAQQPYAITVDCGGIYGARVNIDPACV
jgi:hypothetical protein